MTKEELLSGRKWLQDIPWTRNFWNIWDRTTGENKRQFEDHLKQLVNNSSNDDSIVEGYGLWDGEYFTYIEDKGLSEEKAIAKAILTELHIERPPSIVVLKYPNKSIRFIEYSYSSIDRTYSSEINQHIESINIFSKGMLVVGKYMVKHSDDLVELQNKHCILQGDKLIS